MSDFETEDRSDATETPEVLPTPMQPECPELYGNLPDSDPRKKYFLSRGAEYDTDGRYLGGFGRRK